LALLCEFERRKPSGKSISENSLFFVGTQFTFIGPALQQRISDNGIFAANDQSERVNDGSSSGTTRSGVFSFEKTPNTSGIENAPGDNRRGEVAEFAKNNRAIEFLRHGKNLSQLTFG
jgi:hypothetical protein